MEDQLITFDTAVLAKEKGFDWHDVDWIACDKFKIMIHKGNIITEPIPTNQSLLQKWLREIHNLDVQSYLVEMKSNERQIKQDLDQREYMYRIYKEGIDIPVKLKEDLSYEQALEKGLQEALKLIKL